MNKSFVRALAIVVCLMLISTAAVAKNWKKKDFDKLAGDDKVFHVSSIQLAINGFDFVKSLDAELGMILKTKNSSLTASIPMDKVKTSIEEKYGITVDTAGFMEKYNERMEKGFFPDDPAYNGKIASFDWELANQKNRVAIKIYIFKVGNRIRLNKVQYTIELQKYNPETSGYEKLVDYESKRLTWKKETQIFQLTKDNCYIKK